jgi:hypothetical protein
MDFATSVHRFDPDDPTNPLSHFEPMVREVFSLLKQS